MTTMKLPGLSAVLEDANYAEDDGEESDFHETRADVEPLGSSAFSCPVDSRLPPLITTHPDVGSRAAAVSADDVKGDIHDSSTQVKAGTDPKLKKVGRKNATFLAAVDTAVEKIEQEFKGPDSEDFQKNDEADEIVRLARLVTAPAAVSLDNYLSKVRPGLAVSTQVQNTLLANLLREWKEQAGEHAHVPSKFKRFTDWDESQETYEQSSVRFEKSLTDTQKLIEIARGLNNVKSSDSMHAAAFSLPAEEKKKRKPISPSFTAPMEFSITTTTTGPMISNETNVSKVNTSPAGRKPIRVIATELAKQLELLKTNQSEWDAFQQRLVKYRCENSMKIAHIRNAVIDNIRTVHHSNPESRRSAISSKRERHKFHGQIVLERKKKLDDGLLMQKVLSIKRKETNLGLERSARKEKEEKARLQTQISRWIVLVALGSKLYEMRRVMLKVSKEHIFAFQTNRAARVIQRAWRLHHQANVQEARVSAMKIISKAFSRFLQRRRYRQKEVAANLIRTFFAEVHDVSKLMRIVKKYRFSVIKAQRHVSQFLSVRRAEMQLLLLQWDRWESVWWQQRKEKINGEYSGKILPKKAKGRKTADVPLRVPENIKTTLLFDNLLQRRKTFRTTYLQWREAMEGYQKGQRIKIRNPAQSKTMDAEAATPKKPVWITLLPEETIFGLIERGVIQATNSKYTSETLNG